jgi:hypothetical protein
MTHLWHSFKLAEQTPHRGQINLWLARPEPVSARAFSPEHTGSRRLALKNEGNAYSCVLPELKVYAVVVIKGARL